MQKSIPLLVMLLLACSLLPACNNKDGETASGPGFACGRVTNQLGQPLEGADIVVSNVFNHNKTMKTVTGKNGVYCIALPGDAEAGDWTVSGYYRMLHNGEEFILDLASDSCVSFSTGTGGVVNFVLKQKGRQASGGPGAQGVFFGGVISCYPGDGADMSNVTISIKPLQPLIDGSIAKTEILKPEPDADLSWVVNVPIGLYEINAREGNTTLYLRDYTNDIPDTNVITLVRRFEPCPLNGARYWIKFDVLRDNSAMQNGL